mgnify:CR=1 FL=1
MAAKTMLMFSSIWKTELGDKPTFKMMPSSVDCPYNEVIYDPENKFTNGLCNTEAIEFEDIEAEEAEELKALIEKHVSYTNSTKGTKLLAEWTDSLSKFVKVMPTEYKKALKRMETEEQMVEELKA